LQVVYYVCMAAHMDAALHDPAAEQEVRAVVDSIFPFAMLAHFITLSAADKELQLHELPLVALGICMYNRATGAARAAALQAASDEHAADPVAMHAQCRQAMDSRLALLHAYTGAMNSPVPM
jgi:hypothetical protein